MKAFAIATIVSAIFTVWGLFFATPAKADGVLNNYEMYAVSDSYYATCAVFDQEFTGAVLSDTFVTMGVTAAVAQEYGISQDNAMDVVNEQVLEYCTIHWDNLVSVGQYVRGELA